MGVEITGFSADGAGAVIGDALHMMFQNIIAGAGPTVDGLHRVELTVRKAEACLIC